MTTTAALDIPQDKRRRGSGGRRPAPTPQQAVENSEKTLRYLDAKNIKPVKVGRPRTYSPACCEQAVKIAARGGSMHAIACAFGVSRNTLDLWAADFPDFKEALARGAAAHQHWWELHGQGNLNADRYQAQIWSKTMAARFQEYRDAEKGSQPNGLDLSELVGAISQGITAATLQHQDGDRAKVIDAQPVAAHKDDGRK